jgi:hypothetical protein
MCGYDDIDRCGEFEPVGTREKQRRRGMASAVIAKAMGASVKTVRTRYMSGRTETTSQLSVCTENWNSASQTKIKDGEDPHE